MPDDEERTDTTSAERQEQKRLAEELKHKHRVKNPYALAWWITRHEKDKVT